MAAKKILMIVGDFAEDYETMVPKLSFNPDAQQFQPPLTLWGRLFYATI